MNECFMVWIEKNEAHGRIVQNKGKEAGGNSLYPNNINGQKKVRNI